MLSVIIAFAILTGTRAEVTPEDLQYLNELPLDKLLRMKNSLQEILPSNNLNNTTITEPTYLQRFGAQAMPLKGPPIKRTDFEDGILKKGGYHSKISSIFSMSISTLAFLAFGGYLLCLIVHAMKSKQMFNTNVTQPTFFVSAGIKKRPQPQFASYGRKKRASGNSGTLSDSAPTPEVLFSALLQLCEGYAKWNKKFKGI